MKFTKMHGCGNDYVYVDCTKQMLADPCGTAVKVSDRHFGVGGDGLICICSSEVADFRMAMYNADGSEGAMCGNGIRCVAKFVYDKGLTEKTTVTIETKAGIKTLVLTIGADGKVAFVRVDMGIPSTDSPAIPVINMGNSVVNQPLEVTGQVWNATCVSMGNPHCIIFIDRDPRELNLTAIGPDFEFHPNFPDRINTEFVRVLDENTMEMRVWERGSGETLACGTGACAVAVAGYLNGKTGKDVTIHLLGGDLQIELADNGHIFMTGPATTVFEGEIEL